MKDQKVLAIVEAELIADVAQYPPVLGQNAAKEFFDIHGTNAVYMEEDKL